MASVVTRSEFVSLVAGEIVAGIDHAVEHWLARIEQGLAGAGTALDRYMPLNGYFANTRK